MTKKMPYEESIEIFRGVWNNLGLKNKTVNGAFTNAIESMEKQIPKKKVYNADMKWFECPVCGRILIPYYANEGDHCKCGQAIDWSDIDG